jgi:hypothetical protein
MTAATILDVAATVLANACVNAARRIMTELAAGARLSSRPANLGFALLAQRAGAAGTGGGSSDVTELGSDKLSRLSAFDNSGRCSKVYYVAPLSEDIDLK